MTMSSVSAISLCLLLGTKYLILSSIELSEQGRDFLELVQKLFLRLWRETGIFASIDKSMFSNLKCLSSVGTTALVMLLFEGFVKFVFKCS